MSAQPDLDLRVEVCDGCSMITLSGELDLATAARFDEALKAAVARRYAMRVDLRGVSLMDSTGVHALVRGLRLAQAAGRSFATTASTEPEATPPPPGRDREAQLRPASDRNAGPGELLAGCGELLVFVSKTRRQAGRLAAGRSADVM